MDRKVSKGVMISRLNVGIPPLDRFGNMAGEDVEKVWY